jgi:hypothetical protein
VHGVAGRYMYLLLAIGAWSALTNVLGYCGACAGSRCAHRTQRCLFSCKIGDISLAELLHASHQAVWYILIDVFPHRTCLTLSCWSLLLILTAECAAALVLLVDPSLLDSALAAVHPSDLLDVAETCPCTCVPAGIQSLGL